MQEVKNPPLLSAEHAFQTPLVGHTINTNHSVIKWYHGKRNMKLVYAPLLAHQLQASHTYAI